MSTKGKRRRARAASPRGRVALCIERDGVPPFIVDMPRAWVPRELLALASSVRDKKRRGGAR